MIAATRVAKSSLPLAVVAAAALFCLFGIAPNQALAGHEGDVADESMDLFCELDPTGLSCETGTGAVHNLFAAFAQGRYCTLNAEAARFACFNEVEDDRWIAVGNCLNGDDLDCYAEASADAAEALAECAAQFEARLEVCVALGEDKYDPVPNPGDFVDPLQIGGAVAANPYFPLVPGTVWVYEGEEETVTVEVTGETKVILGVTCAVVRDLVAEDGETVEDTLDWYAQDTDGNVWYFGEISANYEDGQLSDVEGSWEAGVGGAKIGVLIPATPEPGAVYRQEFLLGEAEDMAEVLSLAGSAETPAAACDGDCLVTLEYTPLEPDVAEHKYYAPGIGMISEVDPETGEPMIELVELTTP